MDTIPFVKREVIIVDGHSEMAIETLESHSPPNTYQCPAIVQVITTANELRASVPFHDQSNNLL